MPQKIIVDTDPGVDDVLAILLSLSSPELSVALISIVFGNTHAPVAHKNLLKIYHALAKEIMDVPDAKERYAMKGKTVLALGEDGPIGGEKATAAYFVCPLTTRLLHASVVYRQRC
jgi:inosine-uridine nucleoside N-ribohydrolase